MLALPRSLHVDHRGDRGGVQGGKVPSATTSVRAVRRASESSAGVTPRAYRAVAGPPVEARGPIARDRQAAVPRCQVSSSITGRQATHAVAAIATTVAMRKPNTTVHPPVAA